MYLVVNLLTQERVVFETARDVATYMWGRDFAHFAIYVCRRFPWTDGDLHAFEQALEAIP
jgi:hypothetical protein